jgi:hypothetical protein
MSGEDRHRRRLDRILDPAYVADVAALPLDELRRRHRECQEVETEVSYVRRLAQARLEILAAERERRRRGDDLHSLVETLGRILADDHPRSGPGSARLPDPLAPAPDIPWRRGLEHLVSDATLARLPALSDAELERITADLTALEREVSGTRRELHRVAGVLEREVGVRVAAELR